MSKDLFVLPNQSLVICLGSYLSFRLERFFLCSLFLVQKHVFKHIFARHIGETTYFATKVLLFSHTRKYFCKKVHQFSYFSIVPTLFP